MRALVADLRARLMRVREGGGTEATERHRKRGKMTARERIDRLADQPAPFLEFSPLAADGIYDDETPAAGIVTGIGDGRAAAVRRSSPTTRRSKAAPTTR